LGAFEVLDLSAAAERFELLLRFESTCLAFGFFCGSALAESSAFVLEASARETGAEDEARERGGSFGEVPHATTSVQISTPKPARRPETTLEQWRMFAN